MPIRIRDLCEGGIEHLDVIGRRDRPGPPWPQDAGQRLAAVVQEAQRRVVAEGVFFQVVVAFCFSEWQITIVASISSTSPGMTRSAALACGSVPRVSARCTQASSGAAARAPRSRAIAAVSIDFSTRKAVGSEATGRTVLPGRVARRGR